MFKSGISSTTWDTSSDVSQCLLYVPGTCFMKQIKYHGNTVYCKEGGINRHESIHQTWWHWIRTKAFLSGVAISPTDIMSVHLYLMLSSESKTKIDLTAFNCILISEPMGIQHINIHHSECVKKPFMSNYLLSIPANCLRILNLLYIPLQFINMIRRQSSEVEFLLFNTDINTSKIRVRNMYLVSFCVSMWYIMSVGVKGK